MTRSRIIRTGVVVLVVPPLILAAYGALYWAMMTRVLIPLFDPATRSITLRSDPRYFLSSPVRSWSGIDKGLTLFFGPVNRLDRLIRPDQWADKIVPNPNQTTPPAVIEDARPE